MNSIKPSNWHRNKYEVEDLCRAFTKRLKELGYVFECDGNAYLKKISLGASFEIVAETDLELTDLQWLETSDSYQDGLAKDMHQKPQKTH
jgi:hypothetical protein